jgi:hypothetical protein
MSEKGCQDRVGPQSAAIIQRFAVAVAQLVESQIVILVVVGSSPISHPTKQSKIPVRRDFFCPVQLI